MHIQNAETYHGAEAPSSRAIQCRAPEPAAVECREVPRPQCQVPRPEPQCRERPDVDPNAEFEEEPAMRGNAEATASGIRWNIYAVYTNACNPSCCNSKDKASGINVYAESTSHVLVLQIRLGSRHQASKEVTGE